MTQITAPLHEHHKHCDAQLATAEDAARGGDWRACDAAFAAFRADTESHFMAEEDILFPAFEMRTGMSGGPTRMMRMEHMQMRSLLEELERAREARDGASFCGAAETMVVMMQQHNLKEENILYPMCDHALAGNGEVAVRLERALKAAA
jgi:iron-sulfur cluster repair protein YtfE (RIC family)